MTYDLAIGDRSYSSWSLRGWLLFEKFGLPVNLHTARMYTDDFRAMLADFPPARLVPAARIDGSVIYDTLAMAETLNERHPAAAMWPAEPAARAMARSLSAEMHSGFNALRTDCTMNLRRCYPGFEPSDAVLVDVARIEARWTHARSMTASDGPWLFGAYSIADLFYAPVATRIATYSLPVGTEAAAYVRAHLSDPAFRRWRAMGQAEKFVQPGYDKDLPEAPWPGPEALPARAVDQGRPENALCPYSGKLVTHFMELDGRVFGFCSAFCRDKTVADAEVWDEFLSIFRK